MQRRSKRSAEQTPTGKGAELDYSRALRRSKVFELKVEGLTIREMAKRLKADPKTILEDLKGLRAEMISRIDLKQGQKLLAERVEVFEMIIRDARRRFEKAKSDQCRAAFLNTMNRANQDLSKLLQEVGIVEAARVSIEETNDAGEKTTTVITQERPTTDQHIINILKRFETVQS